MAVNGRQLEVLGRFSERARETGANGNVGLEVISASGGRGSLIVATATYREDEGDYAGYRVALWLDELGEVIRCEGAEEPELAELLELGAVADR